MEAEGPREKLAKELRLMYYRGPRFNKDQKEKSLEEADRILALVASDGLREAKARAARPAPAEAGELRNKLARLVFRGSHEEWEYVEMKNEKAFAFQLADRILALVSAPSDGLQSAAWDMLHAVEAADAEGELAENIGGELIDALRAALASAPTGGLREAAVWVQHLLHGQSKDGGSHISDDEWKEAIADLDAALVNAVNELRRTR